MTRPKTKTELIEAANKKYSELQNLMNEMTEKEQQSIFILSEEFLAKQKGEHWKRDKNLRDILVHLYEWHQLLLNWVKKNQQEELTPFLPTAYNWQNYGQLNIEFWEKHQTTLLLEAKKILNDSHTEVVELIEVFSDEELFTKRFFSWTGTTTLGSYCVSATSSHYDWAIKKLKQVKKHGSYVDYQEIK